jgi:hypothetical protein
VKMRGAAQQQSKYLTPKSSIVTEIATLLACTYEILIFPSARA